MALRLLGTRLSKRILPCKGLLPPPLQGRAKTAAISSAEESFASGCLPRAYHQAAWTRSCSPWEALSGSSLIHGTRNFSSGAPTTGNIAKMNSFKRSSSAPGDDKCPKVEAVERCECDYCSSRRDIVKFLERFFVFGTCLNCIGIAWIAHEILQLRQEFKALDSDDHTPPRAYL